MLVACFQTETFLECMALIIFLFLSGIRSCDMSHIQMFVSIAGPAGGLWPCWPRSLVAMLAQITGTEQAVRYYVRTCSLGLHLRTKHAFCRFAASLQFAGHSRHVSACWWLQCSDLSSADDLS